MKIRLPLLAAAAAALSLTAACGGTSTQASAEDYPNDTVSMIVPYAAGGPTDTVARAVAPYFEEQLGESVVVENKEGASGALGMQEMMSRPADGHTLQLVASTAMVVGPLVSDVGYTLEDANLVGAFTQYPYVIAVRADSRWDSAEEFFAEAKQNPGKIRVGSPGAASQGAVELQRMAQLHGTKFTHVPFDGNSKLNAALLGGNIDAIFLVASQDVLSLVDSGKFTALAIDSPQPVSYLDAPTLTELGYDGINLGVSYYGLAVHADTPEAIRSRLEDLLREALSDEQVRKRIGEHYIPEEFVDGKELRTRFTEQREAYKPVVAKLQ